MTTQHDIEEQLQTAVIFTDEDNANIASINLALVKPVLTEPQFKSLSKLIDCISLCHHMNEGVAKQ